MLPQQLRVRTDSAISGPQSHSMPQHATACHSMPQPSSLLRISDTSGSSPWKPTLCPKHNETRLDQISTEHCLKFFSDTKGYCRPSNVCRTIVGNCLEVK